MDTDPQASATLGLGIHPDTPAHSIYNLYMGKANPDSESVSMSDIIIRTLSGIDLVPSHLDLIGAEPALYQYPDRYYILSQEIALIKNRYDHILIDTPPFLGQFVLNGIIAADKIALVFSPDSFALSGYESVRLILKDIEELLGKKIDIDIAILNRWMREKSNLTLLDKIRGFFDKKRDDINPGDELKKEIEIQVRRDIGRIFVVPESDMIAVSNRRGMPLALSGQEDPAGTIFSNIAEFIDTGAMR